MAGEYENELRDRIEKICPADKKSMADAAAHWKTR